MIWIVAPALGKGSGDPPDWATSQAPLVINPANTIDDAYLTRMTDPQPRRGGVGCSARLARLHD
jgi:hypothetical protein